MLFCLRNLPQQRIEVKKGWRGVPPDRESKIRAYMLHNTEKCGTVCATKTLGTAEKR